MAGLSRTAGERGPVTLFRLIEVKHPIHPTDIKQILDARRNGIAVEIDKAHPAIQRLEETDTGDRYELENRCRAMTNPVYVGENTALCRILGSYKFFVDTRDTTFGCHVVLDGYWETWVTVFVARQLQPGMTVIDVGANYGYYTLLFGALVGETGHVYAIEPNPTVLPKLDLSLKLNGLATRTTVVRAAAGASTMAEVLLYAPHGEPGGSMIIASTESARAELGTVYTVPQVMIDDVVHDAARIALVKIDAEGAEESVIEGMSGTLARDKPCLLLEFNVAHYRDPRGFREFLWTDQRRGEGSRGVGL